MATIGSLVVNLSANTAAFQKAMGSAQATVNKLAVAAAAMGGVAIARLASVGDQFDKMSQRTGMSVEELSRFKFAADQSGSSIEAVETSMRKMGELMLNLSHGASAATDTLADLGISAQALSGKNQTQQFQVFAAAIAGIEDPGRRAALAMKVFGKSGTQLLPLINEGAAGFQRLSNESDALGATVTKLQAKLGAQLTDSFNRVSVASDGLFRIIGTHLAPAIVMLADSLATVIAWSQRFGTAFITVGAAVIGAALAFKTLSLALVIYAKRAAIAQAFSGPVGWASLAGAVVAAAAATAVLSSYTDDVGDSLDRAGNEAALAAKAADDSAAAIDQVQQKAARAVANLERMADATKNLKAAMSSMRTPVEAVADSVAEFTEILAAAKTGPIWDSDPLIVSFRESESGFTALSTSISNELAIMRGEATETGLMLQQMLDMKVDPSKIEELRSLFAQRDEITAKDDSAAFWADKEAAMKAQADAIYASLETPADKLRIEEARLADLVKNGALTENAAGEFIAKLKAQQAADAKAQVEPDAKPDSGSTGGSRKFAGAMQRGSSEALAAIIKGGVRSDPVVKEAQKSNKLLAKIDKKLGVKPPIQQIQGPV